MSQALVCGMGVVLRERSGVWAASPFWELRREAGTEGDLGRCRPSPAPTHKEDGPEQSFSSRQLNHQGEVRGRSGGCQPGPA